MGGSEDATHRCRFAAAHFSVHLPHGHRGASLRGRPGPALGGVLRSLAR